MVRFIIFLMLSLLLSFSKSFAQVGVGTTTPDASSVLDVTSIDKGILIPRISLTNVTETMLDGTNTAATGLLIFNTNAGVSGGNGVGYYYFTGTQWERLSTSSNDHDFYEEGTTNVPNDINDDIYTLGKLAIGKNSADYALDITEASTTRGLNVNVLGNSSAISYGAYIQNNNSSGYANYGIYTLASGITDGDKIGIFNEITNTGSDTHTGVRNTLSGTGSGIQTGTVNDVEVSEGGTHYGIRNIMSGSGSGRKYGSWNYIPASAGGAHFGVYSYVDNGFAGFFRGLVTIGTQSELSSTPDRYTLPASRGTDGQIMQTNAVGQLSWVTPTQGDITSVVAGDGLIGGGTDADLSIDVVASNGLTANADEVVLGGALTQNTTIANNTFDLIFNLNATGNFVIQDGGTNHFEVRDTGLTYFGDDTYWNDGSTSGTTIARLYDSGNDGVFEIYKDALVQHQFHSAGTSVINELGQDFDFRVEGNNHQHLFFVDAGNDRLGIRENTPSFDIHLKQSSITQAGAGGFGFESSISNDNWKIYHSGTHFSFAENGIRRGYIEAGTGNYIPTSDRRLKKAIAEVNPVLEKINQMKVYRYLYKDQDVSAKKTIGFMAQDIEPLFPELVGQADDGYLGLNYSGFGVIAIKAIQEQQVIIDAQQQQLEALKMSQDQTNLQLERLLKRIEILENQE